MNYEDIKKFVINSIGLEPTQGGHNIINFKVYDGMLELYRNGSMIFVFDEHVNINFENEYFVIYNDQIRFKMRLFKSVNSFNGKKVWIGLLVINIDKPIIYFIK